MDWDSDHFGILAGRLNLQGGETLATIQSELRSGKFEFVIARVATEDIMGGSLLERSGFSLADVRLRLDIDLSNFARPAPMSNLSITGYDRRYRAKLREIARRSFWSGHFHDDPKFEKTKVSEMYALWVDKCVSENYFIKVAQEEGRVAGFLAAKEREGRFSIDLVAVDRTFRGKGVGHDLLAVSLGEARSRFNQADVGVHLTNVPAVRLYEKIGFRLSASELTYHWWKR